jgi:phosphoribosylaminoimidazole carboxylase (NCAIR synthetase)
MRLMILGGGSSQIAAFRRARRRGMTTILADRDPHAPARELADLFAEASTFDIDGVTRAAQETKAHAILAIGTDQPVLTAAVVSHRLGLPFPLTPDQAVLVTNKRHMKERFSGGAIPTARYGLMDGTLRGWETLRPPYVVKPVDSQGQRGIILAKTSEEVVRHYPIALSFSREDYVLVEEYVPSREVTVSGWAHTPEDVDIWTITDRVTIENPPSLGVCLAHRYPGLHAGAHEGTIRDLTRRICREFALAGGPIYFQMLVRSPDEADGTDSPEYPPVVVNEIAFRLGGAYEDISIPGVAPVDPLDVQLGAVEAAVQAAGTSPASSGANRPAAVPASNPGYGCFAVPLIFAGPGTVSSLSGDAALRNIPGVTDCRFLLPLGTVIRPMENSTQRIAYAVLHGWTKGEINKLVNTVFDTLKILDEKGRNMILDTRERTIFH